jgi:hypothetical protein
MKELIRKVMVDFQRDIDNPGEDSSPSDDENGRPGSR